MSISIQNQVQNACFCSQKNQSPQGVCHTLKYSMEPRWIRRAMGQRVLMHELALTSQDVGGRVSYEGTVFFGKK